jgi:hypothetical protein
MAKPMSVTIRLTAKQRSELKRLTGRDHDEVLFQSVTAQSGGLSSRAVLAGKSVPRKSVHITAPRSIKVSRPRAVQVSRPRSIKVGRPRAVSVNKPRGGMTLGRPRTVLNKG